MNLDDFKPSWKKQHDELANDRFDGLSVNMVTEVVKFETAIMRRDLVEAAAGVTVLIFFGTFLWFGPTTTIITFGIVFTMLAVIEVIMVLIWTRHRNSQPSKDTSLLEFCTAELARVNRQIALQRSITWWYSGPLLLGACIMMYGVMHECKRVAPELSALIYYGFMAAFFACFVAAGIVLYRGSRRTVKSDLTPIRDELSELVQALEENASDCS